MSKVTLTEARQKHEAAVDHNRRQGVVKYNAKNQEVSEKVFEVTEGHKILPDGTVLGPGNRFHPTEREIREIRGRPGRTSLDGKARELAGSEYSSLKANPLTVAGADIGLRALPMTHHALKLALASGLKESDFDGLEPIGEDGQYTKAQVEELVARRAN